MFTAKTWVQFPQVNYLASVRHLTKDSQSAIGAPSIARTKGQGAAMRDITDIGRMSAMKFSFIINQSVDGLL